jgi:hypothetical protein
MAMMSAQFNQHNTIFVRYLLQHQRDWILICSAGRTPGACLFVTKDPEVIKYSTKEGFNNFQRLDQSNDSVCYFFLRGIARIWNMRIYCETLIAFVLLSNSADSVSSDEGGIWEWYLHGWWAGLENAAQGS